MSQPTKSEQPAAPVPPAAQDFPLAERQTASSWRRTRMWWLTVVCAIVAVALVASVVGRSDPKIKVAFESGHGIKPGDALRYRGIEVGRVSAVVLNTAADRVEVEIELERKSAALARQGSQFWIERPRVSLSRVSGLETVVGANYLGVIPGPPGGPEQSVFAGLETPPTLSERAPLEITIRFEEGHGLAVGDVLKHRGIDVGEVTEVLLDQALAGV